jgi:hypothetical protein
MRTHVPNSTLVKLRDVVEIIQEQIDTRTRIIEEFEERINEQEKKQGALLRHDTLSYWTLEQTRTHKHQQEINKCILEDIQKIIIEKLNR